MSLAIESSDLRTLTHVLGHDAAGLFGRQAIGEIQRPRVAPPTGFGWNFAAHPINIYKEGGRRFSTDIDLRSKVSSDIWNGPVYYVSTTGNNNNAGTALNAPLRSLWKARQLLQASSAPGGIIMTLSDPSGVTYWDRFNDLNDTGGAGGSANAKPQKPFALMGTGGRHFMGPIQAGLAWVFDSATMTWSVARSAVAAVIDVSLAADLGLSTRMPRVATGAGADAAARLAATRALVGAQPGTYAQSDGTLVVRMARDVPPSDTTLKVILGFADAINVGPVDAYLSGFTFMGSQQIGAVAVYDKATRNFVMEDVEIAFSGADASTARNTLQVDFTTGFVGLRRVKGMGSLNDHFNFHANEGNLHALMIDCEGVGAGRDGASPAAQSNQIVTLHEDVKAITLNTKGRLSAGGVVRNINASQHWDLGSEYGDDQGDTRFGGNQISSGVVMNDTAKYWGDCTTVRGCVNTFFAGSTTEIRLRDPIEIGGRRTGSGLIAAY